jgi:3-hydroxybutyryl-CoA dehydrogenase
MVITVVTDEELKKELCTQGLSDNDSLRWASEFESVQSSDVIIDLLYNDDASRNEKLSSAGVALINAVYTQQQQFPSNFVRINGWKTFLGRSIVEAANTNDKNRSATEQVFGIFGKSVEWVPDIPGLITPRVVSMIINEAYHSLEEAVSTKEDIDTAMRLGTNYPFGPFEWADRIGLNNIYSLLEFLSRAEPRYTPSSLLVKKANDKWL